MFEEESERLARLEEYRLCQRRGHVSSGVGLGPWSICHYCKVKYKDIVTREEDATSLPTKVARNVPDTNMIEWVDAPES